jgi:preprotein translocase subunit SecD
MNRYPVWKYLLMLVALIAALLYTLPNFFGESPAVQVSSARSVLKVDTTLMQKLESALQANHVPIESALLENDSLKFRFSNTDLQLKARDVMQQVVGEDYVVALNLISSSPDWLTRLGARPMALGLDLRGGVHFLLEVDMKAAVDKAFDKASAEVRRELRQAKIRYGAVRRQGDQLVVLVRDQEAQKLAHQAMAKTLSRMQVQTLAENLITASFRPEALQQLKEDAVKQNITTLHNRVNELGVAEPIIQQQGQGRIVVELPGIQDTAKAKDILGRTASLEVRLVEDDPSKLQAALSGAVPPGFELMDDRSVRQGLSKILVRKEVELTGDNINDAQAGFGERGEAAVHINLDSTGAAIFKDITRANINKRMAMILVEKGKGEVVTAPVIRSEIGGGRVQISGSMNVTEANDIALLLRAGSLAAPMNIVEERTIGPSLGQDNIAKGFDATLYGFVAIAVFMVLYYRVFGLISAVGLGVNLLFLVALLSLLQATLTLPGIAAIALTLGMAIDSNVLINERVREELRNGLPPHSAIFNGYKHAWATILDSNVTTLIAGVALFIFGSGAVRGFAVVHCLGILTSMFSAVFFSRGIVNLVYGYRRRISMLWV